MQIHSFIFFETTFAETHCVMIETMPSNKMLLQLRLVLKIKDLRRIRRRRKVKKNQSKLIILNQLKLILMVNISRILKTLT